MKTAIIATILSIVTLAVADNCYDDGAKAWTSDIRYHAKRACEGYDNQRGAFQGTFTANEDKKGCVNLTPDLKLEMWVTNQNKGQTIDLKDTDCTKEFNGLMDECNWGNGWSYGGAKVIAGWRFR